MNRGGGDRAPSRGPGRALLVLVLLASMPAVGAGVARAQASCLTRSAGSAAAAGPTDRVWTEPLDRTISIRIRDLPLRDALERVSAAARIRISYASDLLPLDREVCLGYESQRVGDVLAALLRGTAVEPVVVAGSGQVVLAPVRAARTGEGAPQLQRSVGVLDRVVVTGSAAGEAQRPLPVALDVVSGHALADRDAGSISSTLDGAVPGVWVWNQSPSSLLARYGSIRGASSFGLSYPKIYIDGIEVANPLLITRLDPQSVERVEVIRGPQGAALYGADAISGVINIVSRHGGTDGGQPGREFRSTAGVTGSDFASNGVLAQTHALALRAGTGVRSASLALSLNSIGEFVPGSYARQLMAGGNFRLVGARSTVTGVARFFGENSGASASPILAGVLDGADRKGWSEPWGQGQTQSNLARHAAGAVGTVGANGPAPDDAPLVFQSEDSAAKQSVRQYTVGATASFQESDRWTHAVTVGIDGYRLRDVSLFGIPVPSPADSALRAASGGADRGSLRLGSVARLGNAERLSATINLAAEHSTVREVSEGGAAYSLSQGGVGYALPYAPAFVAWRSNTGVMAQSTVAFRGAVFLTAGARLERSSVAGANQLATLPMLGLSVVRDAGGVTLKLRSAYGRGIRSPQTTSRITSSLGMRRIVSAVSLASEEQSGVEVGADLFLGGRAALHLTRFDQTASGLIQPVAVAATRWSALAGGSSHDAASGAHAARQLPYQLQNVGVITNAGWELAGSVAAGALTLGGTLSLVESRVRQLASGYTGDLLPGDRMLEVPARTMSLNAAWVGKGWTATASAARAADWINYDRLALARALAGESLAPDDVTGLRLRSYWREYEGVTHLRANVSRELRRGLSLLLSGDNLLGRQYGEPDNVTVLPGRTIAAGLRARF